MPVEKEILVSPVKTIFYFAITLVVLLSSLIQPVFANLVEDQIVLELKSVGALKAVHEAQLLTYLKLAKKQHGFLINFNVKLLKHGIRSFVL